MKHIAIVTMFAIAFSATSYSQSDSAHKEKMQVFKAWTGQWKGEGMMLSGPSEQQKSLVNEKIESRLDGTILVVEGLGTSNGKVVHHAFGIISYDQLNNQYKFKTYLNDGKSADAWFNIVSENKYQWGFDMARGKMKYTILLDPVAKTWNEIGEYSPDGNSWYKSFEMNLSKVE